MLGFRKNKDDQVGKRRRYSYDPIVVANEQENIADMLLTEKNDALLKESLLRSEPRPLDKKVFAEHFEHNARVATDANDMAKLNDQVKRLSHEYDMLSEQLQKYLASPHELIHQQAGSKKMITAGYAVVGVAVFSFLIGMIAILITINMQREVHDLKALTASLTDQAAVEKKANALQTKEMNAQIALLNDKVEKIFEVDNMDNVLQVTRELRKQIHSLASKNLNPTNTHHSSVKEPAKSGKITQPSSKAAEKVAPSKASSEAKTEKTKKITKDKKSPPHEHEEESKPVKHKVATQNHAKSAEKPLTHALPELPKLDNAKIN